MIAKWQKWLRLRKVWTKYLWVLSGYSDSGTQIESAWKQGKKLNQNWKKQNRFHIYNIIIYKFIPKRTAGPIKGACKVGNWQKWDDFEQQIHVKQRSTALTWKRIDNPINSRYYRKYKKKLCKSYNFVLQWMYFCIFCVIFVRNVSKNFWTKLFSKCFNISTIFL